MAAVTAHPARPFTFDDLEDLPDDGYRREVIGGSLVVTPAPSGRHQRASGELFTVLRAAVTSGTMVLAAPFDWRLPDGGSVQPDLMVIRREDFNPDGPLPAGATPLLVVEILSPSNPDQDLALKRRLYERLGVQAYWVVDPSAPSILGLRLRDGRYGVEAEVSGEESFFSHWPYPLQVAAASLG